MSIEKVINKVGPIASASLGPAVLAFLAANPWLIPVVIAGGAAAAAIIEAIHGLSGGAFRPPGNAVDR